MSVHSLCSHAEQACSCALSPSSVSQTLEELSFERGIWAAAVTGNAEKVKSHLQGGTDASARDSSGYTALVRRLVRGSVRDSSSYLIPPPRQPALCSKEWPSGCLRHVDRAWGECQWTDKGYTYAHTHARTHTHTVSNLTRRWGNPTSPSRLQWAHQHCPTAD